MQTVNAGDVSNIRSMYSTSFSNKIRFRHDLWPIKAIIKHTKGAKIALLSTGGHYWDSFLFFPMEHIFLYPFFLNI